MSFFTTHLSEVGETYVEHMRNAGWYGMRMTQCGIACLFHALFPFMFQATASRCIRQLYDHMAQRGRQPVSGDSYWLEFNI